MPVPPAAPKRGGARRPVRGAAAARAAAATLAVLMACRDPAAGPGRLSGVPAPLPVYLAARARSAPFVNGRLDDAAWAHAEPAVLVDTMTGLPARSRTEARLLWDDEALYVAFACQDDVVWVRPGRSDGDALWEDEVVEVFLDRSGRGREYVEIEVSPANARFEARFASPRSDLAAARTWRSGARSAVAVDGAITVGDAPPAPARGWSVELAVPWSSLGGPPRPGERWRMNLFRLETHGRRAPDAQGFSPPLRGDFHAVDRFGWLEFGG
ncbi:MAG TPA: carbohydrate-binding family 9-like protein [Anaeromyxobacteraceae bacterium]|nr:carbohydrate-binding family 9-like protein [Anaeromyxobacteraceae bacterium]